MFVNYADFSQEKGAFFIPYTGLNRIFRESNALSATQLNKFSVIVKQEVNNSQGIKQITKKQYLNIILRLAKFKYPQLYEKHSKGALNKLINEYLIPLLKKQESRGQTHSAFIKQVRQVHLNDHDQLVL